MIFAFVIAIVFALMAKNCERNWLGWGVLGGIFYIAGMFITSVLVRTFLGRIHFSSGGDAILFSIFLALCVGGGICFLGWSLMNAGGRKVESLQSLLKDDTLTRLNDTPIRPDK
jgi:hypothetical protein